MSQQKQGTLIWDGIQIAWKHGTFKDAQTFEIHPHFEIVATDEGGATVSWDNIEVSSDDSSIKGITDLTKLPKQLMVSILDNVVAKVREDEGITRISPSGIEY